MPRVAREGRVAVGAERFAGSPRPRILGVGVAVLLAAATTAGCTRASVSAGEVPPTYIPQPTPDPTMAVVIQGGGQPVSYFPPLDMRASPTPLPAAARPGAVRTPRPAAKPTQSTREAAPVREAPAPPAAPAPAAKPAAPREAAPAPAPKPAAAPTRASAPAPANSGSGGGAPAIINPNTVLPGGTRPNPTPAR